MTSRARDSGKLGATCGTVTLLTLVVMACGGDAKSNSRPTPEAGHGGSAAGDRATGGSAAGGRGSSVSGGASGTAAESGTAGAIGGDAGASGEAAAAHGGAHSGGAVGGSAAEGPEAGQGGRENSEPGAGAGGTSDVGACLGSRDPTPALPQPSELDPQVVARAAAVLGSCWPDDGVDRNSALLWEHDRRAPYFFTRAAAQVHCLATAHCGCDAVDHCLGWAIEPRESDACTDGCRGEVMILCEQIARGLQFRVDCSSVGLTCDDDGFCVEDAGPCSSSGATCNLAGEVEYCDGGAMRRTAACEDLGLACASGACAGTGSSCESDASEPGEMEYVGVSCSGAMLTACVNGGLTSLDCATRGPGFTCQTVMGTSFCGLADDCVPASLGAPSPSHPARCEGDTLTFCNAGRLERIDCRELGFTGCDVESGLGCVPGSVE